MERGRFNIEESNQNALIEMEMRAQMAVTDTVTLHDFDETWGDSLPLYQRGIRVGTGLFGWNGVLPTYSELTNKGGAGYYGEIFGYSPEDWESIMEKIRATRFINKNAPMLHERQNEIAASLNTTHLGVITAKPGTETVFTTFQTDLERFSVLCGLPAILRPDGVPSNQTTPWKRHYNEHISALVPDKFVIMLDDSLSLARATAAYNAQLPRNQIRQLQVVMADGSLTKPVLERGEYVAPNELGIYTATWEQLRDVYDRINQEWTVKN